MLLKRILLPFLTLAVCSTTLVASNYDFNGDGQSDILWKNGSVNHLWKMNKNGQHEYKNIGSKSTQYTIVGTADFNADGITDILWKKNQYYSIWYMNEDGSHRYKYIGQKSSSYSVVGVADFNNDGESDILWKKNQYYSLWYMNTDGSHSYKYIGQKSIKYSIVGIGDFNGNGQADILWKNQKYYSLWYMNRDGRHQYKYIGQKPLTYKVAGVADLDNDNIVDIVWREGSKNVVWYMHENGGHEYQSIGRKNQKYSISVIADFNNDGNADILWRDNSLLALWYMNSDGTHKYKYIGKKSTAYKIKNTTLNSIFSENPISNITSTLYEDAENKISSNWKHISGNYPPVRVPNGFKSTGALVLTPEWVTDYTNLAEYHLAMNNKTQKILEMDMGGLKNYRLENREEVGHIQHHSIGVYVTTTDGRRAMLWDSFFNHGNVKAFASGKWLSYPSPVEHVRGIEEKNRRLSIDKWVHFKVDIEKELQKLEPKNKIISVDTFFATGGFLDNIKLSSH